MADVLNHPLLAQRYFFPSGQLPKNRVDVEVDGATLACAAHPTEGERTVVFFHGNGETTGNWQGTLDEIFNRLGWGLFLAEYRGYGGSTGEPHLGRMLDDVGAIIDAAGPPENLVVMGRSVGSIFALEAVQRFPNIAGLIIESGIADPLERILLRVSPQEIDATDADFEQAEQRLNHEGKMSGYIGPSLVLHTRHDGLVDHSHAERLHAWAGGQSRLRTFEHGNHNSILFENAPDYLQEIADFLHAL
ncbi:MAG: alpha/beta fold hydrolase [Propionibacteriaceae bacterium]|nr:alpha/beta fold hydrolase [Propionibacteriaceae bacterium]